MLALSLGSEAALPLLYPMTRQEQRQLFSIFFKIGVTTIGGGYAMIPMMEREIVDKAGWLSKQEFLDILAVAQATPGIFAVDMAGHIGYKLGGVRMALLAAGANVLPSFVIILLLAAFFHEYKDIQLVEYAFRAIRPVVVAMIAAPVFSMARTADTLHLLDPYPCGRAHLSTRGLTRVCNPRGGTLWLALWPLHFTSPLVL